MIINNFNTQFDSIMVDDPPQPSSGIVTMLQSFYNRLGDIWNGTNPATKENFINLRDDIERHRGGRNRTIDATEDEWNLLDIWYQLTYYKTDPNHISWSDRLFTTLNFIIVSFASIVISTASVRLIMEDGFKLTTGIPVAVGGSILLAFNIIGSVVDLRKEVEKSFKEIDQFIKEGKQTHAFNHIINLSLFLNIGGYFVFYSTEQRNELRNKYGIKLNEILKMPGKIDNVNDLLKETYGFTDPVIRLGIDISDLIGSITGAGVDTYNIVVENVVDFYEKTRKFITGLGQGAMIGIVITIAFAVFSFAMDMEKK
jgi:hypothetical protein